MGQFEVIAIWSAIASLFVMMMVMSQVVRFVIKECNQLHNRLDEQQGHSEKEHVLTYLKSQRSCLQKSYDSTPFDFFSTRASLLSHLDQIDAEIDRIENDEKEVTCL